MREWPFEFPSRSDGRHATDLGPFSLAGSSSMPGRVMAFHHVDETTKRLDAWWCDQLSRSRGVCRIEASAGAGLTHWMRHAAQSASVHGVPVDSRWISTRQLDGFWSRVCDRVGRSTNQGVAPEFDVDGIVRCVMIDDVSPNRFDEIVDRIENGCPRGLLVVLGIRYSEPSGVSRPQCNMPVIRIARPTVDQWVARIQAAIHHAGTPRRVITNAAAGRLCAIDSHAGAIVGRLRRILTWACRVQRPVIEERDVETCFTRPISVSSPKMSSLGCHARRAPHAA